MKRILSVLFFFFGMISFVAAAGHLPTWQERLPAKAKVVETREADLNGDGRAEIVVAYTIPEEGKTVGHASVFERGRNGDYRRYDLKVACPGGNPASITVLDVTGDVRPELIIEAGVAGTVQLLDVYRRSSDGYERLLRTEGLGHVIWDADGDRIPDIISRYRVGSLADQAFQRFRWLGGRFVAWHAPLWTYANPHAVPDRIPDVIGLPLKTAAAKVNLNLGVIAELDSWAPLDRVLRQSVWPGEPRQEVHLAVSAGDTSFRALKPLVAAPEHTAWLQRQVEGVTQVVHTRYLVGPAHYFRLQEPWQVVLGGKAQSVRWIGVGAEVPHVGLLYLTTEEPSPKRMSPPFQVALYTAALR